MAVTFNKRRLSGSTAGRGLTVTATASGNQVVHDPITTAIATGDFDEVWLWATNIHTTSVKLTIEFGATTAANDHIVVTIPPDSGLVQVLPGLLISGNNDIQAFAGVASKINLFGFVNLITES